MIKNMKRLIRNLFFIALLGVLIYAGVRVGIYLYNDLHGNEAKKYLVEKYGFDEKDLFVTNYEKYVFEDVSNCDSLWLKKCTDDDNLSAKIYFKTKKDNKEIEVIEDNNAQFEDNFDAEPTKAWQDKKAKEEEIRRQQEEQQAKDREKAAEREAEKNNKK